MLGIICLIVRLHYAMGTLSAVAPVLNQGQLGSQPSSSPQLRNNNTAEYDLRMYLISNYRMVRPVQRAGDAITVVARLFPIKIQELIEKEERLVLSVRVQLGWIDQTLSWDPITFTNQTSVVLPYDVKIWLPELQIVNSALDMYGIFSMRDRRSPVKAHSNGEVWWHPTGRMDVRCELQLMYFPFDFQRCGIVLEPVIYTQDQLNLTLRPDRSPVALSMYSENEIGEPQEVIFLWTATIIKLIPTVGACGSCLFGMSFRCLWDLVKTGGNGEVYWVSSVTGFSRVEFILYLQRRTTYYKMNIIFPCLLLSVLQLLTFILPIDNDERVPQATTILLSVIVFQTVIVDQLPKSSTSMSLLAIYISTLVGISTATVASSIVCSLFISLRPSCLRIPQCFETYVKPNVVHLSLGDESSPGHKGATKTRRSVRFSPVASQLIGDDVGGGVANNINVAKTGEDTEIVDDTEECVWQRNTDNSFFRYEFGHQHQQTTTHQPQQLARENSFHNSNSSNNKENIEKQQQQRIDKQKQVKRRESHAHVFTFHDSREYAQFSVPYRPISTSRHNRSSVASSNRNSPGSPQFAHQNSQYSDNHFSGVITDNHPGSTPSAYILVIDWFKMSHLINAGMFTICLCLDVLVPLILFYVMPPLHPPHET